MATDELPFSEMDLWELLQVMDIDQRRLFACDCIEHVIGIFEDVYPENNSVHAAIESTRQYAKGEIEYSELAAASSSISVPFLEDVSNQIISAAKYAAWQPPPEWDNKLGEWEGMDPTWEVVLATQKAVLLKHKANEVKEREYDWQRQHAVDILVNT